MQRFVPGYIMVKLGGNLVKMFAQCLCRVSTEHLHLTQVVTSIISGDNRMNKFGRFEGLLDLSNLFILLSLLINVTT